jgi:hypothetical protein
MDVPFRHFLLTRFSVAIFDNRFQDRAWLEKRFELFERFCFPSVQGQSNQSFDWFVFFDSSLPEDLRARVATYSRFPAFHAVYVAGRFGGSTVCEALREFAAPGKYVITSRVDNDDALAIRYIEAVQNRFDEQAFKFVNLTNGFIWDGVRAYSRQNLSNAFISLIERAERFQTVLRFNHTLVQGSGQVLQVDRIPGWLVVVHGDNVRNSACGTPVPNGEWKKHFAISDLCLTADQRHAGQHG